MWNDVEYFRSHDALQHFTMENSKILSGAFLQLFTAYIYRRNTEPYIFSFLLAVAVTIMLVCFTITLSIDYVIVFLLQINLLFVLIRS